MGSLSDEIGKILSDISARREEIKAEYIIAWLCTLPPSEAQMDWVIKNVELVEKWSDDRKTVTWFLREKK